MRRDRNQGKENAKPFLSGKVKFASEEELQRAIANLKYFSVEGHQMRLHQFDQNLKKKPPSDSVSLFSSESSVEARPDNSSALCNLFVKGINPLWTEVDLEEFFKRFGPVKHCKISKVPGKKESKGYGFVWFQRSDDAKSAIDAYRSGLLEFKVDWYSQR